MDAIKEAKLKEVSRESLYLLLKNYCKFSYYLFCDTDNVPKKELCNHPLTAFEDNCQHCSIDNYYFIKDLKARDLMYKISEVI